MRTIITRSLSALLACGPPIEAASTTDATATSTPITTSESLNPSTTAAPTTTLTPTTTDIDPEPGTTSEQAFIATPDGAHGMIECDVWAQNCPPGQKCAAWAEGGGNSWNATKCVDVMGDGLPGDPCSTIGGDVSGMDDCAFGSMCWDIDDEHHGTCRGLCTGTSAVPICPKMHVCPQSSEGVVNLCFPTCDPLLQDCPGDDLCLPYVDVFLCLLDASGDAGQVNDPCEFVNNCDKGLICLNQAAASAACQQPSQGCCQPFCKFPDAPCPNPDQQCLQWFTPPDVPEGYENVGVCVIPD